MPTSKNVTTSLVILGSVLAMTWGASSVELSEDNRISASDSPAQYYLANATDFSQITIFDDRINFSQTNVSTSKQSAGAVNVSMYIHNFSRESGVVALYGYNTSADTGFFRLNPSKSYKIEFDDSEERIVSGQESLDVSFPSTDTNLTVTKADSFNKPPAEPFNPSPGDGDTGVPASTSLSVGVSDPDNDQLDVEFEFADGSSIGEDTGVQSGDTASTSVSGLENGEVYKWNANASDGSLSTQTKDLEFQTNFETKAKKSSQIFTNLDGHVFKVRSQGFDFDSDTDISECFTSYSDQDGNSGTVEGSLDRSSFGNRTEVLCTSSISSSLPGIEVGESVTVSTSFSDGLTTGTTEQRSNVVPNREPVTPATITKTDLGFTQNRPEVSWKDAEISDPDGDPLDIQLFTGLQPSPNNLDAVANEVPTSERLGQRFSIQDGRTHYYRLRVNDTFGATSDFSSDDRFVVNEEPQIDRLELNTSNPQQGDTLRVIAAASDENISKTNITVREDGNLLKESGEITETEDSGVIRSETFKADAKAVYNFSVEFTDNLSETNFSSDKVDLDFETQGSYNRTFSFSQPIREARITFFGDSSGGDIDLSMNTTESNRREVQNHTFVDIANSDELTAGLRLSGTGGSTPKIRSYRVEAKTDFKTSGVYKTIPIPLGDTATVKELRIEETQPEDTNATYSVRAGNSTTVDSEWTEYTTCLRSCDLDLGPYNHTQVRVELSGTDTRTPTVDSVEVAYQ